MARKADTAKVKVDPCISLTWTWVFGSQWYCRRRVGYSPGAGLSAKLRGGTDQVTVCFFGDGASNQTTFHEGINLASVWKLPVIFVCENNEYGISLHQSKHQRVADVADRAVAYGIPGVVVDGNDVMADTSGGEAVKRARAGEGPTLIEA